MVKYQIIYADPPWPYRENWGNGAVHHHYESMSLEDICTLPIDQIADANCHLYLWVTNPLIAEGLRVTKEWGFEYKQLLTWIKTYRDNGLMMGLGYYFRVCTEQCIFAVRGRLPRLDKSIRNAFFAPQTKHSRKPDIFRDIILQHSGNLPRVELFARQKVDGWDCWGNEVESDIEFNR
jgi:N6-adenosine-specific RNA methylase IME4